VAEGARLESVFRGNSNVGSNPTLSAITSGPLSFANWGTSRLPRICQVRRTLGARTTYGAG
jgi:hypothetical protein